ncbi:MAG TPA: UbiD family decarboxylase [Syntrophorhabdales bacterium]|nr:UbiD family decarboxylase [Syntrophorhabdales bacterium]
MTTVAYKDLRQFLSMVEDFGELKKIYGVTWDKDMGGITEILYREKAEKSPALLFDRIPDYPEGYRCLYGMLSSPRRFAFSLGLPLPKEDGKLMDLLLAYRGKMKEMQLIPPRYVETGPVMENVMERSDIDLFKFPVPLHHELDGGRYIGTADAVITRDPEEGWINVGTYRIQLVDKNTCLCYISQGKQGRIQRDKWLDAGKPCPIVVVIGVDPLLYNAARNTVPWGTSEFDYAGGLMGEPVEVIEGKYTGLPIPARAEIVLEGEVVPDRLPEGPFGEWNGYYAGGQKAEPVLKVKRVMFRNSPILTCAASQKPPHSHLFERCFIRSVALWEGIEKAGCPDVKGVWVHGAGSGRTFNVVSIKQRYYGHSRQAGMLASQIPPSAYIGRFIIVVDDDIDPSNLEEVIWAMGTRCDPAQDIEITRKCWGSRLDPLNETDAHYNSRTVIDACIPYERIKIFPKVAQSSPELREKIFSQYGNLMKELMTGK